MKPAPFSYARPESVEEALTCLQDAEETGGRVLGGGQSLIPLMRLRLATPGLLVDVNGVADLARTTVSDSRVRLGAMVRHRTAAGLDPTDATTELLATAAGHIGHAAIRNRGTVGGSLVHADPAAEWPATLAALDAVVECRHADGSTRRVPVRDFVQGPYLSDLEDGELLTVVEVPRLPAAGRTGFAELAATHNGFAVAGAVAVHDGAMVRAATFGKDGLRHHRFDSGDLDPAAPQALADVAAGLTDQEGLDPTPTRLRTEMLRRALLQVVAQEAVHG